MLKEGLGTRLESICVAVLSPCAYCTIWSTIVTNDLIASNFFIHSLGGNNLNDDTIDTISTSLTKLVHLRELQ